MNKQLKLNKDGTVKGRGIEWQEIPGYVGYYASADGRIGSRWKPTRKGRVTLPEVRELKQRPNNHGYLTVAIAPLLSKRRNITVHRLVATAFLGLKPINLQTCHNDGNKLNNNINNLRYDTAKGNNQDKVKHGTSTAGEQNNTTKLTEKDVWDIRMVGRHCLDQFTRKDLAAKFNVRTSTIHLILHGKIWKNVETFI